MLNCYIDDSNMNTGPAYILAGWMAQPKVWAAFSDAWRDVLWMSPRIEYFKYSEAMNFSGQFHGISREMRDEKLKILVGLFEEFKLLGVCAVIPRSVFHPLFGKSRYVDVRNPYMSAFFGLISRLVAYQMQTGSTEEIQFIFDQQDDQMPKVMEGWRAFVEGFPAEYQRLIAGPPTFADDKKVLPLQAADLHAGWSREQEDAIEKGHPQPIPIWGEKSADVQRATWFMSEEVAHELYELIYGRKPPVRIRYTYGYGINWGR